MSVGIRVRPLEDGQLHKNIELVTALYIYISFFCLFMDSNVHIREGDVSVQRLLEINGTDRWSIGII